MIAPTAPVAVHVPRPRIRSGPRFGSTLAVTIAVVVSLAPTLLPRPAATQAVVSGVFVAAALGAAALARRVSGRHRSPGPAELRWLAAAVGAAMIAVGVAVAHRWQNALRAAMSLPPLDIRHWAEVTAGAAVTAVVLIAAAAGARGGVRLLRRRRVATAAVALLVLTAGVLGPALTAPAGTSHAAVGVRPLPSGVSGSPDSLIDRGELGREGTRFVSLPARGTPVRVYAPLGAAPDARSRAALAVRELDRAGGFDRAHLVVAVPTGSGWVDANAVRGFERSWGDDVAIVAQQYSDTPSWVTFVFDRGAATASARALTGAVRAHVRSLPPQDRPQVHVYGQSLGALGGAAVDGAGGRCEVILAGPPAGTPIARAATVVANTSDPVLWWQPSLLWSPPDLSAARRDAPVPVWIPAVSFVQTTIDLLTSLDAAPGHGHRYGEEQARCDPGRR